MTRVGVRELRQHASRYLALVKAGESVEITERGELVALLTPPLAPQRERERFLAAGRLLSPASPSAAPRVPHPVPIAPGEPTNQALLDAGRGERL